jgi:Protein of unknown function (DUF4197)
MMHTSNACVLNLVFLQNRRTLIRSGLLMLPGVGLTQQPAQANLLDSINGTDASAALKMALEKGANFAVDSLGIDGGFLKNAAVKILLPDGLRKVEKLLRAAGQGAQLDSLITSMNSAAEQSVPAARAMLVSAVKAMSVSDAKQVLTGGQNSVTTFFRDKTAQPLGQKFLPVVTKVVGPLGITKRYNDLAGQASAFGLVKGNDVSMEKYVTGKALDGLYHMIGEQERSIRSNPAQAGSKLLEKVFGAMR